MMHLHAAQRGGREQLWQRVHRREAGADSASWEKTYLG